jgi:hypothetical protein
MGLHVNEIIDKSFLLQDLKLRNQKPIQFQIFKHNASSTAWRANTIYKLLHGARLTSVARV